MAEAHREAQAVRERARLYGNAGSHREVKGGWGSTNCYGYAIGLDYVLQPGEKSGNKITANQVSNVGIVAFRIMDDIKAMGGSARIISLDGEIGPDEYRIAVRCGERDYHVMVQNNDGTWSEKHGNAGDSLQHEIGWTPDQDTWDMNEGDGYYDSDVIYIAVKAPTGGF